MFCACFGAEAFRRLQMQAADPPRKGLRLLTARDAPQAAAIARAVLEQRVPWAQEGYQLPDGLQAGADPLHAAGLYYLQEPSAMAPVAALAPQYDEHILDLCAAPGGKSTQIGDLLRRTGVLVANEIDHRRADALAENMERTGITALVTCLPPARLAEFYPGAFDAALVDAPCSGEGMFRKDPAAIDGWNEDLPGVCADRQLDILSAAAAMVRPGGRLVYSTCTFNPLENEWVCTAFLAAHPDWTLAPLTLPGAVPGLSSAALQSAAQRWPVLAGRSSGCDRTADAPTERCARYFPDTAAGEGHFVALFARAGQPSDRPTDRRQDRRTEKRADHRAKRGSGRPVASPQRSLIPTWHKFADGILRREISDAPAVNLFERGSRLYAAPAFPLPPAGVLRPGLPLLAELHRHVVPEHALALALRRDDATQSISLRYGDDRILAYLRGEEFELTREEQEPLHDGWVLIYILDITLGWGKLSGTRVKNHYPRGLRRACRFIWPH